MKLRIIAVGRLKASPLLDLCEEYIKRLGGKIAVTEIDAPKASTPAQEAPLILKAIKDGTLVVALDERGETLSSPAFAAKLDGWAATAGEIAFVIGGADGLADEIRKKARFLLSFGKQTWPHMLVRVMLLEQIYRAKQISAGHPYHRG
jgi:23S rRNA (pseudouridine1915-N3)-methyltransferase